jgi:hypothetical protein
MAVSSWPSPFHPETLDRLFERLPRHWQGAVIPAELYEGATGGSQPAVLPSMMAAPPSRYDGPEPPPALDQPGGLQAAYQWLQAEKERLDAYTRAQLDFIQQKHQEDLQNHYRNEANLVLRAQEVNRELQFLTAQSEALQARARALSESEAALSHQMEKVQRAQEEFLNIQRSSANLQQDTEVQRTLLENLRHETADIQATRAAAHAEYETVARRLEERRQTWERKQEEITARQAALEERCRTLEQGEAAARRRQAELDELEERLCHELETQQTQLAKERKEIEALYHRLREASSHLPCEGFENADRLAIGGKSSA